MLKRLAELTRCRISPIASSRRRGATPIRGNLGFGTIEIVVIAVMGVLLVVAGAALKWQQSLLVDCQQEREMLRSANEEFKTTVENQNQAIDALLSRSNELRQEGAKKLALAKRSRARAEAEMRRLQQARSHAGTCSDAVREVKKGLTP